MDDFPQEPIVAEEIMIREVNCVNEDQSLSEVIAEMEKKKIHDMPVVNSSFDVIGVISAIDIMSMALGIRKDSSQKSAFYRSHFIPDIDLSQISDELFLEKPVSEYVTYEVIACSPEDELPVIAELMMENKVHRALVLSGKSLVGIISSAAFIPLIADEYLIENPNDLDPKDL